MLAWRYDGVAARSAEQALALARAVGAARAEVRALTVLGARPRLPRPRRRGPRAALAGAASSPSETRDRLGLQRAYVNLTDVLTMLGRPRESARLGGDGARRRAPVRHRQHRARRQPDRGAARDRRVGRGRPGSAAALRAITANYPHMLLDHPRRARDRPRRLRRRARAPRGRGAPRCATTAGSALRRLRRRARAVGAPLDGRRRGRARRSRAGALARRGPDPRLALRQGAARAGGAGGARPRPPRRRRASADGSRARRTLLADRPRAPPPRPRRSRRTPPAGSRWPRPSTSAPAASRGPSCGRPPRDAWERLERPPLAAYCRWRQAEALVAAGAPRAEATAPLREAHAVAARIGARPLLRELELLAERARLDPTPPDTRRADATAGLEEHLGLTPREAEVLALVARGLTNREIAAELVISVKTASVHVSHILRKLDAPNRLEAAAIAHPQQDAAGDLSSGGRGRPGETPTAALAPAASRLAGSLWWGAQRQQRPATRRAGCVRHLTRCSTSTRACSDAVC